METGSGDVVGPAEGDEESRSDTAEGETSPDFREVVIGRSVADPTVGEAGQVDGGNAPSPDSEAPDDDARSLEELERRLGETNERWLRAVADFDNYKKRTERDRARERRGAVSGPLKDFLPVVDHLQLAVNAEGSRDDLLAGVELILQQMRKVLESFGVEEIPALGEPFDPARHEAIARFEDPEVNEQTVAEELQKGYLFDGLLLRPSMVRVAVPAGDEPES